MVEGVPMKPMTSAEKADLEAQIDAIPNRRSIHMQLLLDLYEFLFQFDDSWAFGGEIVEGSQRLKERLSKAMDELSDKP